MSEAAKKFIQQNYTDYFESEEELNSMSEMLQAYSDQQNKEKDKKIQKLEDRIHELIYGGGESNKPRNPDG